MPPLLHQSAQRVIAAFPGELDGTFAEAVRTRHDPLAPVLRPHLTLVFPFTSSLTTPELRVFLTSILAGLRPLPVLLDGVTAHGEHLFLNVKRGNDDLIALHDALYTGPLAAFLDPEYTYVPHVTLGVVPERTVRLQALQEARQIAQPLQVVVRQLTLCRKLPDRPWVPELLLPLGEPGSTPPAPRTPPG